MNKPREHWLVHCPDGETRVVSYENGKNGLLPKTLVREVVPIDWEKVWAEVFKRDLSVDTDSKEIQEIIDKYLEGDL